MRIVTSPEVSQDLYLEHMCSSAGRTLEGGVACTLVAWRTGSQYDFVVHGLTAQEDIVAVVRSDEDRMLSILPAGVGTVVRMDLVRHSHDVMFSVIAASAHLLGKLVLLPNAAVARLFVEDQLLERIVELAWTNGVRVGLVVMDRTLAHDHGGVTPTPWEDLADIRVEGTKAWCDDFEVHGVVTPWGYPTLRRVCRVVIEDRIPRQVSLHPSALGLCGHVLNKVFCIDADHSRTTLMHVREHETATVFAGFKVPSSTLSVLTAQVTRLVNDSGLVYPQRCT